MVFEHVELLLITLKDASSSVVLFFYIPGHEINRPPITN